MIKNSNKCKQAALASEANRGLTYTIRIQMQFGTLAQYNRILNTKDWMMYQIEAINKKLDKKDMAKNRKNTCDLAKYENFPPNFNVFFFFYH